MRPPRFDIVVGDDRTHCVLRLFFVVVLVVVVVVVAF